VQIDSRSIWNLKFNGVITNGASYRTPSRFSRRSDLTWSFANIPNQCTQILRCANRLAQDDKQTDPPQGSSAGWISLEEKSAGEDEGPVRDRIYPSEYESAQGSVTGPGVNSPKRNGSVIARKLQQKDKLGTRQEQHDEEEYRQPDADQQRKRKSFTNGHVLPVRLHSLRDCRSVGRQASEGYTFWWVPHHSRNIRKAAPRWLYFAFSSALSSANVFRIAGK
jgi:hypothetical protein